MDRSKKIDNSTETESLESVEILEKIDDKYNIILYNDDVNTFEHVIDCLIKYCKHHPHQAEQCAMIVHYNGKCSIKNGEVDSLLPINNALLENQLSSEIQKL